MNATESTGQPTRASPGGEWPSLDILYDLALRDLESQAKDRELIDGRLGLLLGFIGIIFVGSLGAVSGSDAAGMARGHWRSVQALGLLGALVLLLLASMFAVLAYLPRDFHRPPNLRELRLQFLTQMSARTKLAIVDQTLWAYDLNQAIIADKLGVYRRAAWLFLASLVCLGVAVAGRVTGH